MIKFSPSVYMALSYDDLLVYALHEVINSSKVPTFENLVAKCFGLFPRRFHLPGYPEWPDASLVEKSWLRCRTDKGLIHGSKSKGFSLTIKGLDLVYRVSRKLQGKEKRSTFFKKKGDLRTRSGRFVKHIEQSAAFQKFSEKKDLKNVTEFEFCDLVYSTLDTNSLSRKKNIEELEYHAQNYGRKDIIKFLEKCKEKFTHLLFSPPQKQYKGGMMKRRRK